jgi:hypothetical protein
VLNAYFLVREFVLLFGIVASHFVHPQIFVGAFSTESAYRLLPPVLSVSGGLVPAMPWYLTAGSIFIVSTL